jgi:hypothetical protein
MLAMSDNELDSATGQGFSSFTFNPTTGVAEADFNIAAEGYWTIDSLKMGYWNPGSGLGWDQNWANVSFGTPSTNIVLQGFFIQATFSNFSSPANRQLTSLEIGFKNVLSGTLSALFNSLSSLGPTVVANRANLGQQTYSPSSFYFVIAPPNANSGNTNLNNGGIWVHF